MTITQRTLPMRGLDYPAGRHAIQTAEGGRRIFARWFSKLLVKSCAMHDIGPEGFALLSIIVEAEDSRRYRSPARFYNDRLCNYLGISEDSLVRIRNSCVRHGFLHYERGGKRTAGVYWVLIPESIMHISEDLDESEVMLSPQNQGFICGEKPGESAGRTPGEPREKYRTLIPNPSPNPTPAPIGGGGVELNSPDGLRPTADTAEQSARGDDLTEQACSWDQTTVAELTRECLAVGVRDRRRGARAVRSASTLGWTPDTVRQAIEFVTKHAATWKSPGGVLIWRLEQPAEDIRRGWPEEPEAANDAKRKAALSLQQSAAARQAHDEHAAHVAAEAERYQQLEFEFGKVLDAKPLEELVALAHQASLAAIAIATLKRKGRAEGIVRRRLLVVLAEAAS
jgi:hypothetical protein